MKPSQRNASNVRTRAMAMAPAARCKSREGVVIDNAGNLYVADTGKRSIRTITLAGVVTYGVAVVSNLF